MSNKPRTREHFPRMKTRGINRPLKRRIDRFIRAIDQAGREIRQLGRAFDRVGRVFNESARP